MIPVQKTIRPREPAIAPRSGCHVESAEDGAIAWDILRRQRFDLIVTDHEMPGVSGLALLGKRRAAGLMTPAVMARGTRPTEVVAQFPRLKPAGLLQKPHSTADWWQMIEGMLRAPADPQGMVAMAPGSSNHSTT
jgi:CheY-like chemotaxis protein